MNYGHKVVKKLPHKENKGNCVGCGLYDPFSYSGTIIKGTSFGERTVETMSPIKVSGILECLDKQIPIVVGGEVEQVNKRFAYHNKVSGRICRKCASDYRTVKGPDGKDIPVVKLHASPSQSSLLVPEVERVMDVVESRESSSTPSSIPTKSLSHQDNHWLNVGRRK